MYWDLRDHLQKLTEPKTPKPRKVSKKSPERSSGPLTPDPPKCSRKSPRSQENSWIWQFSWLFGLFWELFGGSGVRGPELLSGDFFETFRGFGVLGSVDGRGDPKSCMQKMSACMVLTNFFKRRLLQKSEGNFSNKVAGEFCRGFFGQLFGAFSDLFSRRFREGISFPNFVERSILRLPLSKLCAVPFALQNRALFEGEKRAKRCWEKVRKPAKGAKRKKGRVKTGQFFLGNNRRKSPPQNPLQNSNQNLGASGRPIFIQCRYWEELRSVYEVSRLQPSTGWKSCTHGSRYFYPVLGLGPGERAPMAFPDSSSVLDKFQSASFAAPNPHCQDLALKLLRASL